MIAVIDYWEALFSRPSRAGLIEAAMPPPRRSPSTVSFPALHGRASLKPRTRAAASRMNSRFSRPSRAGLIEAPRRRRRPPHGATGFSRPSRAGLIEARSPGAGPGRTPSRFPALHGRASLKRDRPATLEVPRRRFPALHGRASLKLIVPMTYYFSSFKFSRPSRAGLIEAFGGGASFGASRSFPALHGRASLKHADRSRPGARSTVFPPFTGGPH